MTLEDVITEALRLAVGSGLVPWAGALVVVVVLALAIMAVRSGALRLPEIGPGDPALPPDVAPVAAPSEWSPNVTSNDKPGGDRPGDGG